MSSVVLALVVAQVVDPAQAAAYHRLAITCAARQAEAIPLEETRPDSMPAEVLRRCAAEAERAATGMAAAIAGADPAIARANVEAKMRREAQTRIIARLESGAPAGSIAGSAPGIETSAVRYISCARLAINHRLEGVHLGEDMATVVDPVPDRRRDHLIGLARSSCARSLADHRRLLAGADGPVARTWSVEAIEDIAVGSYVRMGGRVSAGARR